MNKILFMIIMCKYVISYDNNEESNEKYIDLLPEEEKQEFLNRIARRILEGIKSNDTPNESHVDITDDQLDAHDAFVQEILKEESHNMENEKRRSGNNKVDENDQVHTSLNENRNEHNDGEVELNTGDKDEHIDLTLRTGRRQKRKNDDNVSEKAITEMSYDVIPVKTVYTQFENDDIEVNNGTMISLPNESRTLKEMQKSNLVKLNNGEENMTTLVYQQEENLSNEENVSDSRNLSNLIIDNKALLSDSINESVIVGLNSQTVRKSFQNKLKLGTTAMLYFEPTSDENTRTEYYNVDGKKATFSPITVSEEVTGVIKNDWGSIQKKYEKSSEYPENQGKETNTVYYNITSTVTTETTIDNITNSPVNETETSKDINTTVTINNITHLDSHKSNGKLSRSMTYSIEHTDEETGPAEPTKETDSILDLSEPKDIRNLRVTKNISTEAVVPTTVLENTTTATYIKYDNIRNLSVTESYHIFTSDDPVDVKDEENITERGLTNSQKTRNNTIKTALRARLSNFDESQFDVHQSVQNVDEQYKKVKVYEVFEVDPNQPHFITTGKPLQSEHPLYVPIYNYAPENAYFRPYNKFGPNLEDYHSKNIIKIKSEEDLKQLNARNRFSRYSKNNERYHIQVGNTKKSNDKHKNKTKRPMQYGFMKPVTQKFLNQEIYYNPYDYADSDYYFGRILRSRKKHMTPSEIEIKYMPNSNEDEHPISSIHQSDSIKDHVRAVRNILYLQKLFGYVPRVDEKAIRKANTFIGKHKTSKRIKKKKISMDYYFNRADPEKVTKYEFFDLIKSKFRDNVDTNMVPLTPKPLNFNSDSRSKSEKPDINSKQINQEIEEVPFNKLFQSMLVVLKDSIQVKNDKLVKYDWLKTTVNIQAALRKLLDLIKQMKYGEHVHPKDIELLKYSIYLFKSSVTILEIESTNDNLYAIKDTKERAKSVIKFPKTKFKTKIKKPIQLWMKFATFLRGQENEEYETKVDLLSHFEDLLKTLLYYLNDFHDAIKHISIITEYKNQNWLEDLNSIYLKKGNKENLAKVILHLSLSRLLDSIEDSSSQGVEESFRTFLKKNRVTVEKSKEECVFVLKVLEELRNLNESVS